MNRSLDEIGLELVRIHRNQTDAAIAIGQAVLDEVDDGSEDISGVVVRTIARLRKENAELQEKLEGEAANAMAVVNADSGYSDSDRVAIVERAATLIPLAPSNPLVVAVKASAVATFGTEVERSAWLRSRGWKQKLIGWTCDDSLIAMTIQQAVAKQQMVDLKPFAWMLKPEFLK